MTRRRKKRRMAKNGDDVVEEEDKSSNWLIPFISDIISQRMEEDKSCSNCRILSDSDILQRVEDHITRLSSILSLSRDHTFILLRHYNWSDAEEVAIAWFDNEDSVRKAVGLLETPLVGLQSSDSMECKTCFKSYHPKEFDSASCGHKFCTKCWINYINTSIGDGPGCLGLRCPEPTCYALVNRAMVNRLAPTKAKDKYERFLVLSYVEGNRKLKWCPAPDCDFAVEFTQSLEKMVVKGLIDEWNYDVLCRCSNHFCWFCTEEAHSPVDCDTARKWSESLSPDSNTKSCPKCKTPIENRKTTEEGCSRITCGCGFQFCRICLRPACKSSHYYAKRWLRYDISRKKALSYLREMQTVKIKELAKIILELGEDFGWLRVVVEACKQMVECSRVLKWSYVYGYYKYNSHRRRRDDEEETEEEKLKKVFFEYAQGEAKRWLNKLRECAHKEMEQYLVLNNEDSPIPALLGFSQFMHKLTALTKATRAYFEKLLKRLENGALLLDI